MMLYHQWKQFINDKDFTFHRKKSAEFARILHHCAVQLPVLNCIFCCQTYKATSSLTSCFEGFLNFYLSLGPEIWSSPLGQTRPTTLFPVLKHFVVGFSARDQFSSCFRFDKLTSSSINNHFLCPATETPLPLQQCPASQSGLIKICTLGCTWSVAFCSSRWEC